MGSPLREVTILGNHSVEISAASFEEAVRTMWGRDRSSDAATREATKALLSKLRLIEVRLDPPDAEVDWGAFTQPIAGRPRAEWQAAYDESAVDVDQGRWAFFLHEVDDTRPLETPSGLRQLPTACPCPSHLKCKTYGVPG